MIRRDWRKGAADTQRALREVCRPRGGHRRSGEVRENWPIGDRTYTVERCADCGAWAEVSEARVGSRWIEGDGRFTSRG